MTDRDHQAGTGPHCHSCLLFESLNEQKRFLLPFLQEGLTRGEHCLFLCSDDVRDDWALELQAYGIDVMAALESGSLAITPGTEWRQRQFRPLPRVREMWEYIEARRGAYSALRIAVDASWLRIDPPVDAAAVCQWEAAVDLLFQGEQIECVCMYDLHLHLPSAIHTALRTHARVLTDGQRRKNPFYEAPQVVERDLFQSDADAATVDKMLRHVRGIEGRRSSGSPGDECK